MSWDLNVWLQWLYKLVIEWCHDILPMLEELNKITQETVNNYSKMCNLKINTNRANMGV